jgi:DNA polymerase-1
MSARFFVVDGPGFLYRAYHALPYLSNSKGQATHAVRGVSTMLLKLLREENPAYAAVAWDPPGPTFREEKLRLTRRRVRGCPTISAARSPSSSASSRRSGCPSSR